MVGLYRIVMLLFVIYCLGCLIGQVVIKIVPELRLTRRSWVRCRNFAMADENFLLRNVLPENRDLFEEIFLNEDSDDAEFEGWDGDDLDEVEEHRNVFEDDSWVQGALPPSGRTFIGNAGVTNPPEEGETLSHLDIFQRFFTEDVIDMMVLETNRYAASYLGNRTLPQHSRLRKWVPTTVGEMKAFLGMVIAMGLVRQTDIQEYWTTNEVTSTPFFGTVMSRDRFMNVMSFFHLCDNNTAVQRGLDGYSPLQKLGRPYTEILKRFQDCYNPGRNIAIDEGMIPWRGKLNFRVYSPDKPIKYGLKMYMLCDSANGYCSRLELYTGREGVQLDCSGNGSTYDVVMRLMEPYLHKGHHLYTDNYYSSPQLFYDLFMNATLACGTLRSNRRGVPKALKEAHPAKGEISVFNNGTLVALKYADKKDVSFLTTIHEGVMVDTGKRDHDGNRIVRPDCVLSYNKHMGAVDRCDQMVSYNGFDRRTLKWWKKVFFHILGIAVLNSYIIYKEMSQHPVLQRVFRREVVRQLVMEADVTGPESRGRKKGDNLQRLSARHFIGHLPPTGTKSAARRRCVVCGPGEMELYRAQHQGLPAPRRLGRETTFQCKQCCVPLCVEPCFELYHTKAEFVLAYKRLKLTTQPGQEE